MSKTVQSMSENDKSFLTAEVFGATPMNIFVKRWKMRLAHECLSSITSNTTIKSENDWETSAISSERNIVIRETFFNGGHTDRSGEHAK